MIITKLLPHQEHLVKQCQDSLPLCALFAPVGSGKTLVALTIAHALSIDRVLVTAKPDLAYIEWPIEIVKHTNCYFHRVSSDSDSYRFGKDLYSSPVFFLISHDYLKYHLDILEQIHFEFWIGDESPAYKNPRTIRSRQLRKIVSRIPNRMIISPLPVSEHLEDIFGQMLLLDDGLALGKFITEFRRRHMLPHPSGYGWVPKAEAFDRITHALKPYVVGLDDTEDFSIPPTEYELIPLNRSWDIETENAYNKLKDEFSLILKDKHIDLNYASAVFCKLHQITGGTVIVDKNTVHQFHNPPKLQVVKTLLHLFQKTKTVIWVRYRAEAEMLSRDLNCSKLTGESSRTSRQHMLDQFSKVESGTLVLTYGFSQGFNALIGTHNMIFYSLPWSYLDLAQAIGRVERLGGSSSKLYFLVLEDTVDVRLYDILQRKEFDLISVHNFKELQNG